MKNKLALQLAILFFLAFGFNFVFASLDSEIQWIDGISGVALVSQIEKTDKAVRTYSVTSNHSNVMEAIRAGFQKKGWTVTKFSNVTTAGFGVRTLTATKVGMEVKVSLQDATSLGNLVVTIRGTSNDNPKSENITITDKESTNAGAELIINDSGITKTYQCSNSSITVNGNSNHITLFGSVSALSINGDNNHIIVNAKCPSISVTGDENKVSWSRKANKKEPSINNLGTDNSFNEVP